MQAQSSRQARCTPAMVQAFSARNLQLLHAIETTVDSLSADVRIFGALADDVDARLHDLQQGNGAAGPLDPEGRVSANLSKTGDALARIHVDAVHRHAAACSDHRLSDDDGVADAWNDYLGSVCHLHDAVEALREWIAIHDSVLQPSTGDVFDSVDELFESLMAGK